MRFRVASGDNPGVTIALHNPSQSDDRSGRMASVTFHQPDSTQVYRFDQVNPDSLREYRYYDELFYVNKKISTDGTVQTGDRKLSVYSSDPRVRKLLETAADKGLKLRFFARLREYRNEMELVIESPQYLLTKPNRS